MYEKKIEKAREIPHYEDQDSQDWMALAYGEIVFDLEQLIERAPKARMIGGEMVLKILNEIDSLDNPK